jgi:hypothetical protein
MLELRCCSQSALGEHEGELCSVAVMVVCSVVVYSVVTIKIKGYYFWSEATVVFFSFVRI